METFVKGELVIMQHATHFTAWNGVIAVVVGTLGSRNAWDLNTRERVPLTGYKVLPVVEGGVKVICEPYQIRKLRKPDATCEDSKDQEVESPQSEAVPSG